MTDNTIVVFRGDIQVTKLILDHFKNAPKIPLADLFLLKILKSYATTLSDSVREYLGQFDARLKKPRKDFCVLQTRDTLKHVVGQLYVKRYFQEKAKVQAVDMFKSIKVGLKQMIQVVDWLADTDRNAAKKKVDNIIGFIGYPDFQYNDTFLSDLYDFHVDSFKWLDNNVQYRNALVQGQKEAIISKPEKVWYGDGSFHINAFFNMIENTMTYSAGMLQSPFFHAHKPMSMNYGSAGSIIGHEITHGFDSQGHCFDFNGNYNDWWSNASFEGFKNLSRCYVEQYSKPFMGHDVSDLFLSFIIQVTLYLLSFCTVFFFIKLLQFQFENKVS